ncbi:hypothetical protein R3P38DRAFT_2574020 [Favolaschia claudopus]|uniref:Ricin B lectin domain-containing protein n=1 Tax=Favolaschia claudopus TaxID=2862362 RepID=A0AAV9ZNS7_9AGAR
MQLISSIISLIIVATMSATATPNPAVGPTPALAGLLNINDFQGFGLNLVDNGPSPPGEGTAVFVFPGSFSNAVNQEWSLIPQGSNTYRIANGLDSSLFLSYPAAAFGGNAYGAELIVSSKFPATFALQTISASANTVRIVEVGSGRALTSWKAVPGMSGAPAILAQIDPSLQTQQSWKIVAARELVPIESI